MSRFDVHVRDVHRSSCSASRPPEGDVGYCSDLFDVVKSPRPWLESEGRVRVGMGVVTAMLRLVGPEWDRWWV